MMNFSIVSTVFQTVSAGHHLIHFNSNDESKISEWIVFFLKSILKNGWLRIEIKINIFTKFLFNVSCEEIQRNDLPLLISSK